LEAKGAVRHEAQDRTFVFYAVHEENEVTASATRELLTRVFDGSVSGLVAHLLTHEKISRAEIKRLRKLIDEAEGK
jgi:BlaI family penicillinase repressor